LGIDKQKLAESIKSATDVMYKTLSESKFFKSLNNEEKYKVIKGTFSDNGQDNLQKNNHFNPMSKIGDLWKNYFGMDESWSFGRNALAFMLVQLPEVPAYFIPAYTQAKNAGDAKALKKGEGYRGLMSGALEGLAVGAIVSGKNMKFGKEMIPYVCIGASMQFLSSKIFPWVGEKFGSLQYVKKASKAALNANMTSQQLEKVPVTTQQKRVIQKPQIQGQYTNSSNMKI